MTGGSGFIGGHCILHLLAAGHNVRATVRNLQRETAVREMLRRAGSPTDNRLSFATADLEKAQGWSEAVAGCDYVLHVASPVPASAPAHEDDLIVPAREGALRVLRAARDGGVRRVVLTSSFAAIGYGHKQQTVPFNETNWTSLNSDVSAYAKSKTFSERAAWDFIAAEGGDLELAVINPTAVFGPLLGSDYSSSILIVQRLMEHTIAGCPKLYFGIVDVRDVADLHLRAMTNPAAAGQRFLALADHFYSMRDIARVLKRRMGAAARKVPTLQLPNWMVRLAALRDPVLRQTLPELGKVKNASGEKARRLLGWSPRSSEESIVATAESLIRFGLLKH